MNILHLHLKKKWFDAIKSGEKTVEFRRASDYWRKRLIGREYGQIWLYCGYPAKYDKSKVIKRRWSLVVKETILHEEFGDEPVDVFCIDVSKNLCDFNPTVYAGYPIGMFHCPKCLEMVIAGLPHY